MKSLFSLLMGKIITISILLNRASGVTYCVETNTSGTYCRCSTINDDQCYNNTLQYFMVNMATTINRPANENATVVMLFMPGTHNVNFTGKINITVPGKLNMTGLNHSNVTVRANRACYDPNDSIVECGLFFEHIVVAIEYFTFHNVSIKLNNASMTLYNCLYLSESLFNIDHSTVTFSGDMIFANSSIFTTYSYFGTITLSGNTIFTNNTAYGGGAMYLDSSTLNITSNSVVLFSNNIALDLGGAIYLVGSKINIAPGANVTFANNRAYDKGGAIYFEPGITLSQVLSQDNPHKCFFYQSLEGGTTAGIHINFTNNTAGNAGDDIYGASLEDCSLESNHYKNNLIHHNESDFSISLVSSDPLRICICDNNGNGTYVPQCNKTNLNREVFPGEIFSFSIAIVGWDFGVTNGMVYFRVSSSSISKSKSVADGKRCTNLKYSLSSHNQLPEHIKLYLTPVNPTKDFLNHLLKCDIWDDSSCIHYIPVIYNITLRQCPPGFYLSNQSCICYLLGEVFKGCNISNGIGYILWNRTAWVSTTNNNGVVYARYCPFDYCNKSQDAADEWIDIQNQDSQCAYKRTGKLCGKCKWNESYSLAIGSSQCTKCDYDNGLALLIFFTAAGFLLVFFINAINLTVTQGIINGLLFYANIIWAYQSILFPQQVKGSIREWFKAFEILRVFVAWLNLDFGIQMCFFKGLDVFSKTLLQYLFPIYLWIITGIIITCARYSAKITNLFGNRAVPILATLFLFSSIKLLKTIIDSLAPTQLIEISKNNHHTLHIVWSLDGSFNYFLSWHALIFLVAVFFFIFLWLPYTLLLFLMQWIQRKSHLRVLKWVPRLTPVYDAYFAPLKDKHHYWFGVLLITRCILLIIVMATYTTYPTVNYVLLVVINALLLGYGNYFRVYKDKHVQFSESFFFLHLILIGGAGVVDESMRHNVVRASIIIVLIMFCGLVIWNLRVFTRTNLCILKRRKMRREYNPELKHILLEEKIYNQVILISEIRL